MASYVEIANLALLKLAQDVSISALDERSKEARVMSRLYAHARDLTLAERPWPFAVKSQALAMVAEPSLGWGYRFAYPLDCVRALALTDEAGWGAVSQRWPDLAGLPAYGVESGAAGTSITSDLPAPYLTYVSRVEDPGRFSAPFIEAYVCQLALQAGPSLKGELAINMRPRLLQEYELAISKAHVAAIESQPDPWPMTPSLAARA